MSAGSLPRLDLKSLDFHERRWSFVARSDGPDPLFIKVPKASLHTALVGALDGIVERRLARNEFKALRTLAA